MSMADLRSLRDRTGAGLGDCKRALTEAGGDLDSAVEALYHAGLVSDEIALAPRSAFGAWRDDTGHRAFLVEVHATGILPPPAPLLRETAHQIATHLATGDVPALPKHLERHATFHLYSPNGLVYAATFCDDSIGVLLELTTPPATDLKAASSLAADIARHIAASSPTYRSEADVPAEVWDQLAAEFGARFDAQDHFLIVSEGDDSPEERVAHEPTEAQRSAVIRTRQAHWRNEHVLLQQLLQESPPRKVADLLTDLGMELRGFLRIDREQQTSSPQDFST